jgi:hypothetical protein
MNNKMLTMFSVIVESVAKWWAFILTKIMI